MNLSGWEEIRDKEYRHGIVNAQIEVDLPLQIRALRKQLVGTQPDLSKLTGMKQPRISAMEKPGGAHFTLETLRRLAQAFDVALIVRFAPFSELLDWSGKFNPDAFRVPSFTEEFQEESEPKASQHVVTEVEEMLAATKGQTVGTLRQLAYGLPLGWRDLGKRATLRQLSGSFPPAFASSFPPAFAPPFELEATVMNSGIDMASYKLLEADTSDLKQTGKVISIDAHPHYGQLDIKEVPARAYGGR